MRVYVQNFFRMVVVAHPLEATALLSGFPFFKQLLHIVPVNGVIPVNIL